MDGIDDFWSEPMDRMIHLVASACQLKEERMTSMKVNSAFVIVSQNLPPRVVQ
jgi:hypothetical protein